MRTFLEDDRAWPGRFVCGIRGDVLRCITFAVNVRRMQNVALQPQIVTSARMAAGMTSRARRPETFTSAG
ncbi:hypothetical protein [Dokdonella sp.]|uniref:hypothetical protein n=1 Tax=Dokdonella sp. TaxID=2291710 RepID=UPI001AFDEE01|nr:hypothetical protein [Dokdonella sp.]MBO9662726.1 hypothetical protein [Dokdonella sp.]